MICEQYDTKKIIRRLSKSKKFKRDVNPTHVFLTTKTDTYQVITDNQQQAEEAKKVMSDLGLDPTIERVGRVVKVKAKK